MVIRVRVALTVVAAALVLSAACTPPTRYAVVGGRSFRLSPDMVPPKKDALAKEDASAAPRPYTVSVAERGRVWVAELPQVPGPFEMTIPMDVDGGVQLPMAEVNPATEAKVQRYLLGVARVKDLAAAGRNELALVVLDEVLADYPSDERLWLMKGTLHRRSGQPGRALEAWKKAQELAPADPEVIEALRTLEAEDQP